MAVRGEFGLKRVACGAWVAIIIVAGCAEPGGQAVGALASAPQSYSALPAGRDQDSCWGKDVRPAIVETVLERVLVQPGQRDAEGNVLRPPVYREQRRQAIVQERQEIWFEIPCQDRLTPDIIASLQRALKARGLYAGALSGQMDTRTRAAIRRFQSAEGLDSAVLSLWAARKLGLVAVQRS